MRAGEVVINNAGFTVNFYDQSVWVAFDIKNYSLPRENVSAWIKPFEIIRGCPFSLPGFTIPGSERFSNTTVFFPEGYECWYLADMHVLYSQ